MDDIELTYERAIGLLDRAVALRAVFEDYGLTLRRQWSS